MCFHLRGGHDSSGRCGGGHSCWSDHGSDAGPWGGFVSWIDRLLATGCHHRRRFDVGCRGFRCACATSRRLDQILIDFGIKNKTKQLFSIRSFKRRLAHLLLSAAGVVFRLICLCSVLLCCSWVWKSGRKPIHVGGANNLLSSKSRVDHAVFL